MSCDEYKNAGQRTNSADFYQFVKQILRYSTTDRLFLLWCLAEACPEKQVLILLLWNNCFVILTFGVSVGMNPNVVLSIHQTLGAFWNLLLLMVSLLSIILVVTMITIIIIVTGSSSSGGSSRSSSSSSCSNIVVVAIVVTAAAVVILIPSSKSCFLNYYL